MKTFLLSLILSLSFYAIYAQKTVAIIGGGMAGISAAYHIHQKHPDAKVYVFEKARKAGGNAQTVKLKTNEGDSTAVDIGPQYFASSQWEAYLQFLEEMLGSDAYSYESMNGTLLIQRPDEKKPVLVSPLGMRLRGEKMKKLLKFKRFNKEAYLLFQGKVKRSFLTVEQWVEGLDFDVSFKQEIIYPFLAASLGTTVREIKQVSARDVAKLFAFRKPKANNKFHIMVDGMGTLIERCAKKLEQSGVGIQYNAAIQNVQRKIDKWVLTYENNGVKVSTSVDFVVFATHADQTRKLIQEETSLQSIADELKHLTYFEAKIAIHTDATYVNLDKPAFLNIYTDKNNELLGSTMNLGMISERLDGYYKSWVTGQQLEKLKKNGKLIHETTFWHPLITTDFIKHLNEAKDIVSKIPSIYFAGGWSEGLETQNSAVISGKHAEEKFAAFLKLELK